ncbi:acyltransferase domain-containing protein [Streptomyces sp. GSL17-111]|uniref:acyltransferase domain-containing protein n=1 Tax=Streptomyces sp. GSL17-111 TaxID=3121596 RepID=UPI0030F3F70C
MTRTPVGAAGAAPDEEPGAEAFGAWLLERLAAYLGRSIGPDTPFAEAGLDSVAALGLYGDIEEKYGPLIDPTDIQLYPTARELARFLALRTPRPLNRRSRVRAAFVFTGQGCQHPHLTSGLYLHSTGYRGHLEEAADALVPFLGGRSVVELILSGDPGVHQTAFTQPVLFAIGYALARMLEESGAQPVAVAGHGVGEYAAAVVGGALPLHDAARLVALRGAFMQHLPAGGGMLATGATAERATEAAAGEEDVSVSAYNANRATVLSGGLPGLERVAGRLAADGVACRYLRVAHAFQSPLMEPVVPRFAAVARRVPGGPPRLPFYSTVTGAAADGPLDAAYWTRQITEPVRFSDAVRHLVAEQRPTHLVEIGPRPVLLPFLRRLAGAEGPACLPVCRGPRTNAVDLAGVLSALEAGPFAGALAA